MLDRSCFKCIDLIAQIHRKCGKNVSSIILVSTNISSKTNKTQYLEAPTVLTLILMLSECSLNALIAL